MYNLLHLCTTICCTTKLHNSTVNYNLLHLHILLCIDVDICNVVGVLLWCPVIADVLVQCVRVVQLNCVKVQCMACCVSGSVL